MPVADAQPTEPQPKPATIYDVARLANVSHQTVSRYVKGFTGIRPETRLRVESALAELDYRPNLAARSLATNRSNRIVAFTHELLEVGPGKTLQGANAAAREAGYTLDIISLGAHSREAVDAAMASLNERELAGVIAFAATDDLVEAFATRTFGIPVVVNAEPEDGEADDLADAIATRTNSAGTTLAVEHLVALGHREFFHVAGPAGWFAARNRERAYAQTLSQHRLSSQGTVRGSWTASSGYEAVLGIPLDTGITALVVANDQMALGALRALRVRGVRVPEEISVVGFDDMPEAEFFEPPLTTIRVDFEQPGRRAVARLLTAIDGSATVADSSRDAAAAPVAPSLVIRLSTAAAQQR